MYRWQKNNNISSFAEEKKALVCSFLTLNKEYFNGKLEIKTNAVERGDVVPINIDNDITYEKRK